MWSDQAADVGDVLLVPVVPGVNLPLSDMPIYIVVLLAHGAWHESAHAIAAAAEDCRVRAVGLFLWIVYPVSQVSSSQFFCFAPIPTQQVRR